MTRGPYKSKPTPGSLGELILAFYRSPTYRDWAPGTLRKNDRFLRALMREMREFPVAELRRGDIVMMRDELADRPAAAANWLKLIRSLLDYAVDLEMVERNVARDKIKGLRPKAPGGFRTWHEHEIDAFLAHWPLGSLPHRVLTLALYTGAARADLVRLGWHSIDGDRISYRRQKTARNDGPLIDLRIAPPLAEVLALVPPGQMTFLQTTWGGPRSDKSLTGDMTGWVLAAGLGDPDANGRHLNLHGLRKAVGRRMAEVGCSPHEIMSVLGHTNVAAAKPYTDAYDRSRAADGAFDKMGAAAPTNITRLRTDRK